MIRKRFFLAAAPILALLLVPSVASAENFFPTITADENGAPAAGCSLREAIIAANTDGDHNGCVGDGGDDGPDTILLAAGADYVRTITDPGAEEDAAATGDLDIVDAGGGQEEDLTITTNLPVPPPIGPAAKISGNAIGSGGRVLHVVSLDAVLSLSVVEIESGRSVSSGGGGILNLGTVNMERSLVTLNTSETNGGGIENAGTLNATDSTIEGNFARENGGGLDNFPGTATLNNVTVANNQANTMAALPDGVAGGVNEAGGTVNLVNTIVATNFQAFLPFPGPVPDCAGGPTSMGYNLIGNTSGCGWVSTTGDVTNPATAGLGFLGANGGPTRTVPLAAGSPARDAGNPAAVGSGGNACSTADQRTFARPVDGNGDGVGVCDMGAFEADPLPPPAGGANTPTTSTPTPTAVPAKPKCRKKKKKKKRSRAAMAARKKKKKKKC